MSYLYRESKTGKLVKPQTKLQSLASKENYAIFQLKGMIANLIHLKGVLPMSRYNELMLDLDSSVDCIKRTQAARNPKLLTKGSNLDETK
jgi:hypothetical protein